MIFVMIIIHGSDCSAKHGLITTLSSIISALIQYKTNGLHDVFLLEISQLVSLYLFLSPFLVIIPNFNNSNNSGMDYDDYGL